MCTKQPLRVCQSVAFVVDLHSLDDPRYLSRWEHYVEKERFSSCTCEYPHPRVWEKSSSTQELVITHITTSWPIHITVTPVPLISLASLLQCMVRYVSVTLVVNIYVPTRLLVRGIIRERANGSVLYLGWQSNLP